METPDRLPYNPNNPTPFGYRPSLVAEIIWQLSRPVSLLPRSNT